MHYNRFTLRGQSKKRARSVAGYRERSEMSEIHIMSTEPVGTRTCIKLLEASSDSV